MTAHKKLPIGIQTFSEIINNGYHYVDKTQYIDALVNDAKYYFLSRPRRFGKSLLLDTCQQLFEGRKPLFEGLHIHDKWDWDTTYPVVRFSFGSGVMQSRADLDQRIHALLQDNAKGLGIELDLSYDIPGQFKQLLNLTKQKYSQPVVLLIDEYDKPILDNITNHEIATENREGLKHLYSVIKDADPFLKFVLITGVSKFSKVSLFSGLNNLKDITLVPKYSAICGYTDTDLDTEFATHLEGLDRQLVKDWFNGYNWLGTSVYNPFDILLLLADRIFKPYWFETATPTFLVKVLGERQVNTLDLAAMHSDQDLLGQFDVGDIGTEALLFQTGYLTIGAVDEPIPGIWEYTLTYPNVEVEVSLNKALLPTQGFSISAVTKTRSTLLKALRNCDFALLETHLKALYASIPHDWYRNNPLNNYEGHYASVFYSHFAAIGLHVAVEDASVNGKVDMAIQFNNTTFIFEFKVVDDAPTGKAIDQIIHNNYAQKYIKDGWKTAAIGVEFSKAQRQIVVLEGVMV